MSSHLHDDFGNEKHEINAVENAGSRGSPVAGSYNYVPGTPEETRLVRKIDLRLIPMLWLCYLFNYLDRTNVGNAKTGGMQDELHLSSSDYSLLLSIFFVGYLLNEVPSNMILSRSRPSVFLPTIMVIWGGMSIGVKGVTSLGGMVAFRLVLGLVEAGFFPGVMLLMSCWYKPAELAKRIALFYTASLLAGAFGGLLAGGVIEGLEGKAGTPGWKWLFIIEGLMTVFVATIAFFVLPNYPGTTKWLTPEERELATIRLVAGNEAATDDEEPHMSHWTAFKEACKDPKTWCFALLYNLLNMVGTISYFFPTLMSALGHKGRQAQFYTVPIYTVALVISVTGGFVADRTRQKAWIVTAACLLATVSFIICVTVKDSNVRYAFICFGAGGIWTAVPVTLSWVVTMFDGREKRAVCIALINGIGNTASIYGSFFWTDPPRYIKGFGLTTGFCGLAMIVAIGCKLMFNDKGVKRTS